MRKENKPISRPRNFDFCLATNRNWTTLHRLELRGSFQNSSLIASKHHVNITKLKTKPNFYIISPLECLTTPSFNVQQTRMYGESNAESSLNTRSVRFEGETLPSHNSKKDIDLNYGIVNQRNSFEIFTTKTRDDRNRRNPLSSDTHQSPRHHLRPPPLTASHTIQSKTLIKTVSKFSRKAKKQQPSPSEAAVPQGAEKTSALIGKPTLRHVSHLYHPTFLLMNLLSTYGKSRPQNLAPRCTRCRAVLPLFNFCVYGPALLLDAFAYSSSFCIGRGVRFEEQPWILSRSGFPIRFVASIIDW
ncbi:hypothetical protein AVEN_85163-1 [Araneus ventricosus]|uniref:Uncharacterized protein n=1 Tax=Araneus ventricosus TaxID=182803 RepID=A0A4Y2LFJ0_ARAVE|nr:hypothetical protein AVEN_85163-1 [Araneus ventricosus]